MRNPFKTAKKNLQEKAVEAGIQASIEGVKAKAKSHMEENWRDYAEKGATMLVSGVIAGLVGGTVSSRTSRTKIVERNQTIYNITINNFK